jgi:hypothetical protein
MNTRVVAYALATLLGGVPLAGAEEPGKTGARVGGAVEEGAKTGGKTAWEGMKTFGRATGAFFTGGTGAARKAWQEGEVRTKEEARAGARATRQAADGGATSGTSGDAPPAEVPDGEIHEAPIDEAPAGENPTR